MTAALLLSGDEIVAATVHLDHLNKSDVLKILKVLEPYDDNMKVLTKKELGLNGGLGSLGVAPAQVGVDGCGQCHVFLLRPADPHKCDS